MFGHLNDQAHQESDELESHQKFTIEEIVLKVKEFIRDMDPATKKRILTDPEQSFREFWMNSIAQLVISTEEERETSLIIEHMEIFESVLNMKTPAGLITSRLFQGARSSWPWPAAAREFSYST